MSVHKRGVAGQRKHVRPGLKPRALVLAVAACFGMSAQANPTAPVVVHGSAGFAAAGNILNITNSHNAIINWGSFSIGANELTRFIQPSALSAVLNRVTGQDPSAILGALQSNGRVFLVNPNGIMFGAGAQIDVAGLVASTLNISNDDFLNNRMRFTDGAGAGDVLNQGNITGGNVYLIGNAVTNDGLINTPNGEVLLAAGNSVELVNPGTPNLRVEIVAPDNEARNLGSIAAEAGRVGIYAGLIQQGGSINASSAVAEGGRILLKAARNTTLAAGSQTTASGASGGSITIQSGDTTLAAGSIEAQGGSGAGGTVQVLGNKVGLTGNAAIDVSGDSGGGTVLVGGDYQGKNPEVQNAYRTYVGEDVSIKADARTQGDGGKVIVWADDITRYYGSISARGGANAGDGGFAEVSGKHHLDFRGTADLGAPKGQVGTLLLDPDFISIDSFGLDPLPTIGLGPEVGYLFADPGAYGGPSISIDSALINAATANVILQANEDIDVNAPISMANTGKSITMRAGGFLNVGASITTNGGEITLVAGDPGAAPGQPNGGAININAALDSTNAGASSGANITLTSNIADVGGNSVFIDANITAGTAGNVSISGFEIDQTAGRSITANNLTLTGLTANSDAILLGTLTLGNTVLGTGVLNASGLRQLSFQHTAGFYDIGGISITGDLAISGAGIPELTGNISFGSSFTAGTLEVLSGARTITGGTYASTVTHVAPGGTLNLSTTTSNIGTLTLDFGSTLGGTGTVNVTTLNWDTTGGASDITGSGTLATSGVSTLSGASINSHRLSSGRIWNNTGTMTLSGGHMSLNSSATFNNNNVVNVTTGSAIGFDSNGAGTNTFNNAGTINWITPGPAGISVMTAFNNTGVINVGAGTMNLAVGGTHTGTFDVDPTGTLQFSNGTHNLNAGAAFADAGALQFTGATTTVNVNTPLTSGHAVALSSGTLGGTSNLTLNNSFNWSGGTISGAGTLTTGVGSTTTIGASPLLNAKTWNNSGTVTIAGTDRLTLTNSATLNNSGTINLDGTNSNPIYYSVGGNTLNNSGILNKNSAGTQVLDIGGTINNTGPFNISAGRLDLNNGGTHTGDFEVVSGATLGLTSGIHNFNAGITFEGAGTMQIAGATVTVNINNPLTLGLTEPAVVMSSGSLVGNSSLTLNSTFDWSGGVISGAGQLITGTTATTTIGAAPELNGKSWQNSGIVNIGGTGRLLLYGSATLDNLAGGLIELSGTNSNPIFHAGGVNTLNNAGTLAKTSAGIQALEIGGTISNTGLLHVAAGQLNLDNNGTHTGTFDIDPGAILRFSANSHQLNAGSVFTDTGTLQVTGATVFNVNTPLTFGAAQPAVEVYGGNVVGNSNLTLNGSFDWSGGTISGPGLLVTGPTATTSISGFPALSTKTWQNSGTVTIGGGSRLTLSGGATLDNLVGGVIDLAGSNSNPIYYSVGGNTINNAGALDKTSAGTQVLDIGGTINNTGVMHVNAGQLDLNNGGTHSGTFDIDPAATLRFASGTHNINAGSAFTDTGALQIAGATFSVLTPLVFGAGNPVVTLSNGTVAGSSDLTFNGTFDWSGGTISGPGLLVTGPTATTTITGLPTLSTKTWQNSGAVTIGGTGRLTLTGGATLDNLAGGLVELTGSNSNPIYYSVGGNTINNAGALDKTSAGTQVLDIGGTINNTGVLYVIAGQLDLNNDGTHGGTFGIDPAATLRFVSGTHNLNAGSAFTDTGALQIAGGTVNVNTPLVFGAGNPVVALSNGTVAGSSDLTLNGTFNWSGGTISGAGLLTTGPTATTTIGASPLLSGKNWQNSGTMTIGGTGRLTLTGGAILDNQPGGIIDLAGTNGNPIYYSSGVNFFNNSGTLNKITGGTQALDVNGNIFNAGLINVQSGILEVSDFPSNNHVGTIRTATGSVFRTNADLTNNGTLEGTGTFDVGPANTLTNEGVLSPGASPGLLTVTGNLTLGAGSIIDAEINGTTRGTQYDAIDVSGDVVLGGVLNVAYNAFTPVGGQQFSLIGAAGTVSGGFAAINDPNALTPQITLGPPGVFKLGLFTGLLSWDGGASTLNWLDALNWSGDFVPTNANDVVIGTGFGAIVVNGAAEAKSIVADSPLLLSTGSLTLGNPSQFNDLFTLAGGSLSGSGSVTVGGSAGALAWTGGAMGAGGAFTLGGGRSGSLSGALTLDRLFQNNGMLSVSNTTVGGTGSLVNAGTVEFLSGIVNINLPYMATGQSTISGATVNFNGGAPTALANLTMSTGALQSADNITVSGNFDWSGGTVGGAGQLITSSTAVTNVTGLVGLAPGKTWGNDGTVNLTGASTVDLGDSTPAIFNNNAGGTVNIGSTAGWSFISDPSSQAGQINNAGTVNVNNNTSWEAAYNNLASGTLNIADGKFVSMQNGQNISGTVNIGAGSTLWVSERHGVDAVFSNLVIGGSGTLQVLGSGPVAKFTNVAAPGATLRLGSGGQVGVVNGSALFGTLLLDSLALGTNFSMSDGQFAQATGNLTVPPGAVHGGLNNVYVAQAGDLLVPGLVDGGSGSITLVAPAGSVLVNGGAVFAPVINLFGGNVSVGDAAATSPSEVGALSVLTVQTDGSLKVLGGSGAGASALLSSSGALTVTTGADVEVAGGAGTNAWAKISGNPDVVLASIGGVVRVDAGSGSGAYGLIEAAALPTIHAHFPNLAGGGYFVNGVEGAVYDAATGSGFMSGGLPAVPGSTLLVTYGLTGPSLIEEIITAPTQTLVAATIESTDAPESGQQQQATEDEKEKENKKDAPVCR